MFSIVQKGAVVLKPRQLIDIDGKILEELRAEFEGKIGEKGLIVKIIRVVDRSFGTPIEGNLGGDLNFNVFFESLNIDPERGDHLFGIRINSIKEPGIFAKHSIFPIDCMIPSAVENYDENYYVRLREENRTFNGSILELTKRKGADSITVIVERLKRLEIKLKNRKTVLSPPILLMEASSWVAEKKDPGDEISLISDIADAKLKFG